MAGRDLPDNAQLSFPEPSTTLDSRDGNLCSHLPLNLTHAFQVLFKRKPVHYLPRPIIEDDNSEASLKTREGTAQDLRLTGYRCGLSQRPARSLQTMKPTYKGKRHI